MLHPTILFVPLDDRPVCCDFVAELGRAAGLQMQTPGRELLGDREHPGDVDRLWGWLDQQPAEGVAALIVSAEMVCFGGLVASRQSQAPFAAIVPRLQRLLRIAAKVPTYVSALIPRTPAQPGAEDAAHWRSPDPDALRAHRERHLRLNELLIRSAGAFRYLLIGQDDTAPGSPGATERGQLQGRVEELGARNVLLTSGADELGARLLGRCLADLTGLSPSVQVLYTYPDAISGIPRYEATPLRRTVEEHVESAGCHLAVEAVDILLWVHNFEGAQAEARDQTGAAAAPVADLLPEMREAADAEQVVALADVRFSNGADDAVVRTLLEAPRFADIVAYGGWNTCSNALGSALAQAVVAWHLRQLSVAGSDRLYRPLLFTRLLDDWGYQAVVRPRLSERLTAGGGDPAALGDAEREMEAQALAGLRAEALPLLQASFRHHPVALRGVAFPWHRLFEIALDLDVTRFGRTGPGGIVVEDYDPRWVELYDEARRAIKRALGEMVRGIEHVGSTSVRGLAAKPVIDILLGVEVGDLDRIIEPLQGIGYEYNPDWEISMPRRRYFRRLRSDGTNTHHLHAVVHGSDFWVRHLRFRDYLRAHPEVAGEYGKLKKDLAAQQQGSIDYTFSKSEFIRAVEAKAGVQRRTPDRERRS